MSLLRLAAASGAIVFAVAGCTRRIPAEPAEDLAGLSLPLNTSAAVRLSVAGSVGEKPAELLLEVAQPITLVTTGCFEPSASSDTSVRYPLPEGGFGEAAQVELGNARIGGRRLGALRAALTKGDAVCEVTLGSDVLSKYALEVDPAVRTVTFVKPSTREAYVQRAASAEAQASGYEHQLIELVLDPAGDWPMLAARISQDEQRLTGAFVLTTSTSGSLLDAQAASDAELAIGPDFIRKLGVPGNVPIPKSIGGNLYSIDRLELTPGFGLSRVGMESTNEWKNDSAVGALGGDVWGRFHATIDPSAGTLLLRRPRVFVSGERQRCATGKQGENSEEACFVLNQRDRGDGGLAWVTTVWRQLPQGGQLHLEALDANGQVISGACRVGMSFAPTDRGASAAHNLPWPGMEKSLPQCAEALQSAKQVRFSMWEEAPLQECPGACAYVIDARTDRVACECQGNALGMMGDAERRFMQLYEDLIKRGGEKQKAPVEPDEPEDDL